MTEIIQPKEKITIDDIETLKVVADSRRMHLLHLLKTPKTVKDLAEEMGMEPSKLYYHVNLLEKHDLIQIVATNIVSGIIEKQYQIAAREFGVARHLLTSSDPTDKEIEDLLEIIFDGTKDDVRRGMKKGVIAMEQTSNPPDLSSVIGRMVVGLKPAQFETFAKKMHDLVEEILTTENKEDVDGTQPYGITFALYPLSAPENPAKSQE